MKAVEKEIAAVRNIIRLLKECRSIAQDSDSLEEVESCNKDIETCNRELKKLLEKRERKCFL